MSKLGFTFYPKDWWSSDTYFDLTPIQRYIYLECIFLMYSRNGTMDSDKNKLERRLGMQISQDDWKEISKNFVDEGDCLSLKSVDNRMKRVTANRENGKKGGRPTGTQQQITTVTGKSVPNNLTNGHFVYLIQDIQANQWKIGETKNLKSRRLTIKRPTKNLLIYDYAIHDFETCYSIERKVLSEFSHKIISGEWLELDADDLSKILWLFNGYNNPNNHNNNPPLEREREIESKREIESECEKKEESHAPVFQNSYGKQPIENLKKNCAGHSSWLDSIGMKNSLLPHQVLEWFEAFVLHLLSTGKTEETESEFKRYCSSWISSEIRQGRTPKVENQSKDAPPKTANQIAQEVIIKKYGNRINQG
ncbi:GIY-YIG nuclease family protein [Sphingobacterium sp.]|uniref:DUF7833 domain-containing protein n=1 Tax=Sphingobacterium sp. TaxID=341027 RepID=UPI0028A194D1|nr:GIY-YIG nuclease family protein [Sphingobacterium sp.]